MFGKQHHPWQIELNLWILLFWTWEGSKGRNGVGWTSARWSWWMPGLDGSPSCMSIPCCATIPQSFQKKGLWNNGPPGMCSSLRLGEEEGSTLFTKCLAIKLISDDNFWNFILRLPKGCLYWQDVLKCVSFLEKRVGFCPSETQILWKHL